LLEKEDVTTVLDPVLERMPPLDIDSAKMLRREDEEENETSASSSEEESESGATSEDDGVADLLGILDNRRIGFRN
jgi:hypothetical protein